ncbi:hypothetical protein D1632_10740 [Chryseobacterium nematophagum]|uniref:Uncharacterized protein n=1 Tax=Chryseobacterium nematophagum TaxID=2305228 RepID=A0A3M7LC01_9FLAO|nr:hypothetical protein [Chryseobacterium nematophagum]RMZ60057.1 hypothetical protein D1632_10740 [Chryseobacterium nematophagum]
MRNISFFRKKKVKYNTVTEKETTSFSLESVTALELQRMIIYGKPCDSIGPYRSKPFVELPYGIVKKYLPRYQEKGFIYETVELILGCQYDAVDLSHASGNEILQFLIWIKNQQEFIYQRELHSLHSEPEPEMIAAGIHKLNSHGGTLTIDMLAERKLWRHKTIENTPYHKVFEKLFMDKDVNDFYKRVAKIREQLNKKK